MGPPPPGYQRGPQYPGTQGQYPQGPPIGGGFDSRVPKPRVIGKGQGAKEKRSYFLNISVVILVLGLLAIGSCDYYMSEFTKSVSGPAEAKLSVPGIAVLEIRGEIFDTQWAVRAVKRFQEDKNVKALLIRIDSPGGAVAPCQELYSVLQNFKKPKIVSMGSIAASGGYYLAVTGDVILANPGTITGSIGVIMEAIEFSEAMEKLGVKSEVIKSGDFKDSGSPFRPMRPDERSVLQSMVMNVYEQFVRDVKQGRPLMTEEAVRALADGRIYSGEEARILGLVDALGGYDEALALTLEKAGLPADKEPSILYENGQYPFWGQIFGEVFSFLRPVRSATSPGVSMKFIYHPGL
jgi:protease-4